MRIYIIYSVRVEYGCSIIREEEGVRHLVGPHGNAPLFLGGGGNVVCLYE
jgi:hypothetical protein